MNGKKDTKARKQTLVLLFRELKEFVKKGKFSDTPLSMTVGWPLSYVVAFCSSLKKFPTLV